MNIQFPQIIRGAGIISMVESINCNMHSYTNHNEVIKINPFYLDHSLYTM